MMKTFFVGIKGVIVSNDKVLLLQKRGEGDFWEVPGGRVDANESLDQTLIRELQEEVPNIEKIKVGRVLDAYRLHKDIEDNVSLTLIFFKVEAEFNGDPQISQEHQAWQWVTKEQAVEIASESCQRAIREALN
jgi:8-oxo-dGTP diphosphatase